ADSCKVVSVLMAAGLAAVNIPDARRIISRRISVTWARKAGSVSRRYTVRRLRPAFTAAWSGEAPHAKASSSSCSPLRLRPAAKVQPSSTRVHRSGGASAQALRLLTRELLPALHDDIAVERVDFHQVGSPPGLLCRNQGRAAAAEQIQDVFAGTRRILQ